MDKIRYKIKTVSPNIESDNPSVSKLPKPASKSVRRVCEIDPYPGDSGKETVKITANAHRKINEKMRNLNTTPMLSIRTATNTPVVSEAEA